MSRSKLEPITYFNRRTGNLETEKVYGEGAVRWIYETRPGQALGEGLLSRPWISSLYGKLQDTRWSKKKVAPFIRKFGIPMEEYEDPGFQSFNEFFIRKFKPGARTFTSQPNELAAFAEARYYAIEKVDPSTRLAVKGIHLSAAQLLGGEERAKPFLGGPAFIARLCPVDYHRYHYPDDGRTIESARLPGPLHSVNPLALRFKGDILITNERRASILETKNFGRLAYVEIGATCVGKIVQSHPEDQPFRRGDEKGYFLFGGSSIVILGEPGRWTPDGDLLEQTTRGHETLVRLGERIASIS